jgi:hypothetical protein
VLAMLEDLRPWQLEEMLRCVDPYSITHTQQEVMGCWSPSSIQHIVCMSSATFTRAHCYSLAIRIQSMLFFGKTQGALCSPPHKPHTHTLTHTHTHTHTNHQHVRPQCLM